MEGLELKTLFGGAYAGRKVLVTGHTGFKGSWLCLWLTRLGAQVTGLALAPDTEPSHWSLLKLDSVHDLRVDLRDRQAVQQVFEQTRPEIVFHLAAQPLVRRSYREPLLTFESNVLGLVHLLEAIRTTQSVKMLVNVTSDKVYREQATTGGYREDDPLGGHDPYSTSKACAELVTECYRKSFFRESELRAASARAGNVIGGGDWSEDRLIPDFVRAASAGRALEIRNPEAVRPWQHVLEPLSGYLRLGQMLLDGAAVEGAWNFGPAAGATISVRALVSKMQALWPVEHLEQRSDAQPREAATLVLDSTKASRELLWHPVWDAGETVRRTLKWYHTFHTDRRLLSDADLSDYVAAASAAGLQWTR
ncbi:MAG TPA: CDP-glucose 4,6-dehydratase [Gammaproteobacteria bacterium]|nr:CDP-glucose 4,6-dehydratase [Gammaproteobacteria bacterium]